MPVLQRAAGPVGARLPPRQRVPALSGGPRGVFTGLDEQTALARLATGEVVVRGRLADASNATLYAVVAPEGTEEGAPEELACVYKPVAGEQPLWDFPDDTLARREVASYAVSAATGWDVVPPTVLRDGPFGPGSVQLWLQQDGAEPAAADEVVLPAPGAGLVDVVPRSAVGSGWLPVLEAEDQRGRPVALVHADDLRLRHVAVLDAVLNNADRKGGHVLPGWSGAVHGVDHGLTFHVEPKLRTVLWGWGGSHLLAEEREVLARLAGGGPDGLGGGLGDLLTDLLAVEEVVATLERVERLLAADRLPRQRGQRTIPWPPF